MCSRVNWIDNVRILAVFFVIWLHVSAEVVVNQPDVASFNWWVGNVADAMSRWCVPLLVMASGALLLSKPSHLEPIVFYKRRFMRIFIPCFFWTVFYFALQMYRYPNFKLLSGIKLLILGTPYFHLWFLYMIVGLYAITPILSGLIVHNSSRFLFWTILLCFVMACPHEILRRHQQINPTSLLALWPPYCGYFLAGYYIIANKNNSNKITRKTLLCIFVACGLLIALLTGILLPFWGNRAWEVMYTYLNPFVVLMSLSLFIAFRTNKHTAQKTNKRLQMLMQRVASLTLGIYLVHPIWLDFLNGQGLNVYIGTPIVGIPLQSCIVFFLSLMTTLIVQIIPGIRRIMG